MTEEQFRITKQREEIDRLAARVAELELLLASQAEETDRVRTDLVASAKETEHFAARVAELEAFIRPFAVGPHDIECDAAYGKCTCVVDDARRILRLPLGCACSTACEGVCSACKAPETGSEGT